MKRYIKNLLKIWLVLIILIFPNKARADELHRIDIKVEIDENGLGHVTETWKTTDDNTNASEKYKVISDLQGIKIRDFHVKANGVDFSEKKPWDIDASFEEKANHYGMVETNDGVELCWGITDFGDNEFELTYTIDPVVVSLNDYDMVYFRFVKENLDPLPDKITLEIAGPHDFDPNDTGIWGFGYEGEYNFKDGKYYAESSGDVQYVVGMMRFPKGTFNTSYKIDENFDYYADMAIEGSDFERSDDYGGEYAEDYDDDSDFGGPGFFSFFGLFRPMIIIFFVFFGGIVSLISALAGKGSGQYGIINHKELKKAKKFKDQYYRDIPYEGHLEDTYLIADKAFETNSIERYLNAFMLSWIYEGAIRFGEYEKQGLFKAKKVSYIEILDRPSDMGRLEKDFFNILASALESSGEERLEQKHIEAYMKNHKSRMEDFFEKFPKESLKALEAGGYLRNDKKKKKISFTDEAYKNRISITPAGIRLYENLIKFKNYLKDYSLIEERDVNEVKLWDQFMIYAAIYGISKEVYENFTTVYPEYAQLSYFDYYMISGLYNYSQDMGRTITSTISPSMQAFESGSSGGFSSFGGGGGSFGGGGGGAGGGSR